MSKLLARQNREHLHKLVFIFVFLFVLFLVLFVVSKTIKVQFGWQMQIDKWDSFYKKGKKDDVNGVNR